MAKPQQHSIDYSVRDPEAGVDKLFFQRWSPRRFKKTPVAPEVLKTILGAARWAPSSYNEQPWLFITNDGERDFDVFLNLLVEANQQWAHTAPVIGFVIARKHSSRTGDPNKVALFDCGSAWMSLTLQARLLGLYTHGMGGIDREAVHDTLGVPRDTHQVICGFALGELDDAEPGDPPSPRRPLENVWHTGRFNKKLV